MFDCWRKLRSKTTDLWPCYLERVRAMTGAGGDGEDGVPASNAPSSLEIAILTHHHHHQHTMEKFKALVSAFSAHYLKAPERAMLARAAERDGEDGEVGPCLMLPREVSLPSNTSTDTTKMRKSSSCVKVCPVALLAQLLRWPDLNASAKDVDSHLCRLAFLCSGDSDGGGAGASCKSAGSSSPESGVGRENAMLDGGDRLECCNPFHWSRAIKEPNMPQRHSEKQLISSLHPSDYHSVDTESVHDKSDRCSSMETGISRVCGGQISAGTTTSASDDDADEDLSRDYPGAKQYCLQYNPGTNHPRSVSAALLLPPPPPSRGSNRRHHHWCLLRYWEESKSLGTGPFKVVQPILNVSHGAAAACRPSSSLECMSLAAIENPARSKVTQSLRDKIGLGMTLILDEEARTVQVYNRSAKLSLFVSSRYLTDTHHSGDGESESARPVKVPPGWLLTVCDLDWVRRPPKTADTTGTPMAAASTKLFDSILVSFGKGWGPGYHRQRVTSCNAWLEIALDNVQ